MIFCCEINRNKLDLATISGQAYCAMYVCKGFLWLLTFENGLWGMLT